VLVNGAGGVGNLVAAFEKLDATPAHVDRGFDGFDVPAAIEVAVLPHLTRLARVDGRAVQADVGIGAAVVGPRDDGRDDEMCRGLLSVAQFDLAVEDARLEADRHTVLDGRAAGPGRDASAHEPLA